MGRLRISYQLDSSPRSRSHGDWAILTSNLRCLLDGEFAHRNVTAVSSL